MSLIFAWIGLLTASNAAERNWTILLSVVGYNPVNGEANSERVATLSRVLPSILINGNSCALLIRSRLLSPAPISTFLPETALAYIPIKEFATILSTPVLIFVLGLFRSTLESTSIPSSSIANSISTVPRGSVISSMCKVLEAIASNVSKITLLTAFSDNWFIAVLLGFKRVA